MTPSDDKISSFQLGVFIYNTVLGVGIITLPAALTKAVNQDAWMVVLLAGGINLILLYFMYMAGKKYSSYGFVGTLKKLFGKFFGTLLALPVIAYYIILAGLEIRIFSETIKVYLLNNTPLEFIIIPLLILAVFLVRSGIEPIARFYEAITPVSILIIIIVLIVPLPHSDFTNIRPFFSESLVNYFNGVKSAIFAFAGYEVFLIIFPFLRKPKESFKAAAAPIIIISGLYAVIIIECIAKLGVKQTQSLIYPTLNLLKASSVPGAFIERIEGILLSLWIIFVFTTVVAFMYGFSVIIGDITNQKKRKHIAAITIPVMYVFSLTGGSVVELFEMVDSISTYLGLYTIVFIPIIMFMFSLLRGKGDKKIES